MNEGDRIFGRITFMKARLTMIVAASFGLSIVAHAQVVGVFDRSLLLANDSIDLGQLGADFASVPDGTAGTSIAGNTFVINSSTQNMQRRDEGNGWNGDFNTGDHLVWNGGSTDGTDGTITFTLGQSVSGFGLQIQANAFGAFTADVAAYDGLGNLIGSFNVNGNNIPQLGTAPFLGVSSSQMNIAKVVYSLSTSGGVGFGLAVNQVSIRQCNVVPEPASIAALGIGAIALVRRRRSK